MKVLLSHISDKKKKFSLESNGLLLDIPEAKGQVTVNMELYAMGEKYFAQGNATATVELTCDICLEKYSMNINEPFQVFISATDDAENEEIIVLSENAIDIDFSVFIRDTLLLGLPIQKRCRPNCQGLDPLTGLNLNYSEKSNSAQSIDPRWEKLLKIKEQLN